MTKVHREMEGVGRTAGHGPYKCQECGEMRAKKDFSQRQLELPKKVGITCRHCNEHDKFEKKEDRRKSLDEARNAHKKNAEIHNKGRQVHQTFHSVTA
ncbi:predicted protein [Micromonas commoda]|uniref:Uncharacterized protein n=1 Tax=Micromonas commoda (strain RCC299 / NOUM17 / CCMP2709) TaxID=296587 RepID=C1EJ40_MICCC|nr:predicted protein [Micromonas commoda]ACO68122.1 predicted protein [Micromonas commoda]|eukprot:XP_002506864.1 predicted protein [Micromonas commoda]